jgi:hypothetical protein
MIRDVRTGVREPQHVVFLATDFRPMIGGIAESLHQLAHHLARHVPVTVMTSVAQNGSAGATAYRLLQLPALPERRLGRRVGDGVPPIRKLHTGAYFLQLWYEARRPPSSRPRIGRWSSSEAGTPPHTSGAQRAVTPAFRIVLS